MTRADTRAAALVVLLFVVLLPAVTPRIYASDEIQYFAYLRSLWFDRDVSFENEYRWFHERGIAADAGFRETFLERTTETGRRINFATIGCALLWSPFYAVADLVVWARGGLRDGYGDPYVAAVAFGSAVYGLLALLLAMDLAGRLTGWRLAPALAAWAGTPLLFYMYVAPPMSHACSAFAVALFTWTWWRVRRQWTAGGGLRLGATAALMAMVREQDLFFVAGPVLDYALTLLARWRQRQHGDAAAMLPALLTGAGAFVLGLTPQLLAYVALNGYPGPSRLVTRKMSWHAPHALEVLVSPAHGHFAWTPLALVALVGLAWLALRGRPRRAGAAHAEAGVGEAGVPATSAPRAGVDDDGQASDARRFAGCALAMVALQVYVAGSVESWTVAGAFGQRRFVATTVFVIVGLGAVLGAARTPMWRGLVGAILVVGVWWNVGLMAQFGAGLMDRQRLDLPRNAYVTFVELPARMPALVARYFLARETFYRRPAGASAPGPAPASPPTPASASEGERR